MLKLPSDEYQMLSNATRSMISEGSLISSIENPMPFSTLDHIASAFFYFTGSIGITMNCYLIFLIITKSPHSLMVYRVFLLNVACSDLVYSLTCTLAQIRIIPTMWAFAYVPLGVVRFIGSEAGYMVYCLQLHAIFYCFLSFPISFGFRFWVLVRPIPEVRQCVMLCMGLWLIAIGQHIMFTFSESPVEEIRAYLFQHKPQYVDQLKYWPLSGNHMIKSPLTSVTLASIVCPMFPIYCLVIYFYTKVQHYLSDNTGALSIQASLPIFFLFPPIFIYGLYHLSIIDWKPAEYLVFMMFSCFPAASPFVTIYFIKPYSMAARRLLRIKLSSKVDKQSPTTVFQDQGTRYSVVAAGESNISANRNT